jgi:hypothetical protein
MRTLTVTRAAYTRLVTLANAATLARRQHEAHIWARVQTLSTLPRAWRTDLRVVGASDLVGVILF